MLARMVKQVGVLAVTTPSLGKICREWSRGGGQCFSRAVRWVD